MVPYRSSKMGDTSMGPDLALHQISASVAWPTRLGLVRFCRLTMPDKNVGDLQKMRIHRDDRQTVLHRGGGNPQIIRWNRCASVPPPVRNHGISRGRVFVDPRSEALRDDDCRHQPLRSFAPYGREESQPFIVRAPQHSSKSKWCCWLNSREAVGHCSIECV